MHADATGTGWLELILQLVSRIDPQLGFALELTLLLATLLSGPRPPKRLLRQGSRQSSSTMRAAFRLVAA